MAISPAYGDRIKPDVYQKYFDESLPVGGEESDANQQVPVPQPPNPDWEEWDAPDVVPEPTIEQDGSDEEQQGPDEVREGSDEESVRPPLGEGGGDGDPDELDEPDESDWRDPQFDRDISEEKGKRSGLLDDLLDILDGKMPGKPSKEDIQTFVTILNIAKGLSEPDRATVWKAMDDWVKAKVAAASAGGKGEAGVFWLFVHGKMDSIQGASPGYSQANFEALAKYARQYAKKHFDYDVK